MADTKEIVRNAVVGTVVGSAVSGIGGEFVKPVVRSAKGLLRSLGRELGVVKKRRRTRRRRRR